MCHLSLHSVCRNESTQQHMTHPQGFVYITPRGVVVNWSKYSTVGIPNCPSGRGKSHVYSLCFFILP